MAQKLSSYVTSDALKDIKAAVLKAFSRPIGSYSAHTCNTMLLQIVMDNHIVEFLSVSPSSSVVLVLLRRSLPPPSLYIPHFPFHCVDSVRIVFHIHHTGFPSFVFLTYAPTGRSPSLRAHPYYPSFNAEEDV
ncbi:hypothetical protein BOTBODRAFT_178455 [Botryobasidium botryosum FD-172 SS1]|uniref:Uncharacterized protein n=1 Tax=Botryobasidium botryosum (strain FD-172 SS1) TaxID=930990 RepID=A0A067MER1_BOTB1|nr:hypothetical protein BOTBODRAFT_178455 [Botryobasidium botryosum FD-172 SS1]